MTQQTLSGRLFMMLASTVMAAILALPAAASDSKDNTMQTYLVIRFEVKEEHRSAFEDIMRNIDSFNVGEPGYISAEVFMGRDDAAVFTVVEKWESKTLHQAHFKRINDSGDWANLMTMMRTAPVMDYFDPIGK